MPGAFHLEAPNGAAPLGGAHAGIYRTPTSPSIESSMYFAKSTGNLYADAATPPLAVKRKRPELAGSTPSNHHAQAQADRSLPSRPQAGRRISSRRDIRYTIGGSVETPNGGDQKQLGYMEDSAYSDVDYRRALGPRRPTNEFNTTSPNAAPPTTGWSRFALQTIGGMVGKVWEFCRDGPFRGFYAGGGRGFVMAPTPVQGKTWCNEHDIPTLPEIPGGFPETDYAPLQNEKPDYTPPPAPKRRQISDSKPADGLGKNWVMVSEPAESKPQVPEAAPTQAVRPSLNRRISKPVSRLNNPTISRENSNAVSHAGGVSLSTRQPASYASARSPIPDRPATPSRLPVPTRPRSSSTVSPKLMQQSFHGTTPSPYAARGHRRSQSTASAASATPARAKRRESSAQEIIQESSPRLDARAKSMVVKRMKQEQQTDARINDFNARLMDMIRQGKEALGTTVEVDGFEDYDRMGNDPWEDD